MTQTLTLAGNDTPKFLIITRMKTTIDLLSPSPGTRRALNVHRFGRPGGRPKAYVHAALHADEHPGLLVAHHLLRLLSRAATEGRVLGEVIVVPMANPIGLSQYLNGHLVGRFDFEGSGNFNRNFPDLAERVQDRIQGSLGADAEANVALIRRTLTQAVKALPRLTEVDALKLTLLELSVDADLVFDLHCDGEALLHLYASRRQREPALELGAQLGAGLVLLEENPGGGPFDEANAGPWWKLSERLGRPLPPACFATTVELRGQADVDDRYAERDALNLFRFLQRREVLAGDPGPLPDITPPEAPLEGVDVLVAPAAGILAYRKRLGDRVGKGEIVAELIDLGAEDAEIARTPIRSSTEGLFFARMADKLVRPGKKFGKIAGGNALSYRRPGKLLED